MDRTDPTNRWSRLMVAAFVTACGLAGCGLVGAGTGEPPAPPVGACYEDMFNAVPFDSARPPVPCDQPHMIETAAVRRFMSTLRERPGDGSADRRAAFVECAEAASDFLGDHFRTGRVSMDVAMPSDRAWADGARWFRCDVWEYERYQDRGVERSRTGSLRGALASGSPLRFGCAMVAKTGERFQPAEYVGCDRPHNTEFAGIFLPEDEPFPAEERDRAERWSKGCHGVVARFAGVPEESRILLLYRGPSKTNWAGGDRAVECLLYLDRNVVGTLRGVGPSALPGG